MKERLSIQQIDRKDSSEERVVLPRDKASLDNQHEVGPVPRESSKSRELTSESRGDRRRRPTAFLISESQNVRECPIGKGHIRASSEQQVSEKVLGSIFVS